MFTFLLMNKPNTTTTRRPRGTVKTLAEGLGITRRAVSSALLAGMPADLDAARQWRLVRVSGDDSAQTLRRERILLVREQREKAKLENEVRRGQLIDISKVQESVVNLVTSAKAELLKLTSDLPPILAGETAPAIQKKMRAAIIAILTNLSNGCDEQYQTDTTTTITKRN